MSRLLMSWIGAADLEGIDAVEADKVGPLARALDSREYDRVLLLSNYESDRGKRYVTWAAKRTSAKVELRQVTLRSPTDYEEIYKIAAAETTRALEGAGRNPMLTFHLSPGTSAMTAIWIILAKTRFAAELIESSKKHGVKTTVVPFELAAELIPDVVRGADSRLAELAGELTPVSPEFGEIVHRSTVMKRLLERAQLCAAHDAAVLIEGESGTGKEMLARAVHQAGRRSAKPFIVVNCGAIPPELVESEFFGHKKGSFTGAGTDRAGHFEEAHGGTLFLDEIGELPLPAQVKLLRVLQEGKVTRVGDSQERPVDVRVIAATNRDLAAEVAEGRFREDLFYRLAVLVLTAPPLRDRQGDVGLLVDAALEKLNAKAAADGRPRKKLSPKGKGLLIHHPWTGNVRELNGTLLRAFVFTRGPTMEEDDIRDALRVGRPGSKPAGPTGPLEPGFNLKELLQDLSRDYIRRALAQSNQKKKEAAELLGFASHQNLSQWIEKLGVKT